MTARTDQRDRPELVRFLARDQIAERVQQPAPRAELVVTDGEVPVIRLYDVIDSWGGYWGISAAEVAAALDALDAGVTEVEVHLNSPGGEAREGTTIANLLRQHPARVVAVVDGLAASAASMIAMGADEVVMAPSSQMMVHDASGGAWGPADFLRQQADALDHLSDSYAAAYARKAGGELAAWREVMRAETWYSPDEAVAAGLADRVLEDAAATDDPAAAVARHDLRVFAHAGREHAPAPRLPSASASGPAAAGGTTSEEARVSDTLLTDLRQSLGLAEDADEAMVMAEHRKAMAALQELNDTTPPVAKLPDGVVTVDAERLARLEADAAAGAQARAQQETDRRTALVAQAVADGRIPPARREPWLAMLAADPGAEQSLAQLAKGTVPLAELGHGQEADPSEDDALFASLFADSKEA